MSGQERVGGVGELEAIADAHGHALDPHSTVTPPSSRRPVHTAVAEPVSSLTVMPRLATESRTLVDSHEMRIAATDPAISMALASGEAVCDAGVRGTWDVQACVPVAPMARSIIDAFSAVSCHRYSTIPDWGGQSGIDDLLLNAGARLLSASSAGYTA